MDNVTQNQTVESNLTLQIVYSNSIEQGFSVFLLVLFALISLLGQGSVMLTIWKSPSLQEKHFKVLLCCCLGDLIQVLIVTPNWLRVFLRGVAKRDCKPPILAGLAMVLFYVNNLKVLLISYERCIYFLHPFQYETKFKTARLMLYEFLIMLVPAIFVAVSYSMYQVEFHASALTCSFPLKKEQFYGQYLLYLCPTILMTTYCTVRIFRLARKSRVGVADQAPNPAQDSFVQQIKIAIRVILLVSSTFWSAVLPSFIIRLVSLQTGITWADMDARTNMAAAVMMRVSSLVLAYVPPAVNPILYYVTRKDLRDALKKLVKLNTNSGD